MEEDFVVRSGVKIAVDKTHRSFEDALDKEYNYAIKSGEHLWTALVSYKMDKKSLREMRDSPLLFDSENLLSMHLGCFICEQVYEPKLLDRRCPGEPR